MIRYLFVLLLATNPLGDFTKIARVNSIKEEARVAYLNADYKSAIEKYHYLIDTLSISNDRILLNLAHAYFKEQDSSSAFSSYVNLLDSEDKITQSIAYQQIGVISGRAGIQMRDEKGKKAIEQALNHFKNALKSDPYNEDARYNYELLKRLLEKIKEEEKKQKEKEKEKNQNQENQDQQNKDQQNQENQENQEQQNKDNKNEDQEKQDQEKQDQEKESDNKNESDEKQDDSKKENEEKSDEEKDAEEQKQNEENENNKDEESKESDNPSFSDKLKDMNLSEEKAKMLLEAMKNSEKQYLQQIKRKPTKPKTKGKPDW
ncbi:MAG: hypothetical protein OEY34_03945 [Cyclobacteriaceae bacterium]|nr:hypothetical protein [Cyclobacteriaceae bacterium]